MYRAVESFLREKSKCGCLGTNPNYYQNNVTAANELIIQVATQIELN